MDLKAQQAETREVFASLAKKGPLPDTSDVDYFFVPDEPGTNWRPCAEALSQLGFSCVYMAEDGSPYLVATLADQIISATVIWMGEELSTVVAAKFGFTPDGWGFDG